MVENNANFSRSLLSEMEKSHIPGRAVSLTGPNTRQNLEVQTPAHTETHREGTAQKDPDRRPSPGRREEPRTREEGRGLGGLRDPGRGQRSGEGTDIQGREQTVACSLSFEHSSLLPIGDQKLQTPLGWAVCLVGRLERSER